MLILTDLPDMSLIGNYKIAVILSEQGSGLTETFNMDFEILDPNEE